MNKYSNLFSSSIYSFVTVLDFLAQAYNSRMVTIEKNAMDYHIQDSKHILFFSKLCYIRFGCHGSFSFLLPRLLVE